MNICIIIQRNNYTGFVCTFNYCITVYINLNVRKINKNNTRFTDIRKVLNKNSYTYIAIAMLISVCVE